MEIFIGYGCLFVRSVNHVTALSERERHAIIDNTTCKAKSRHSDKREVFYKKKTLSTGGQIWYNTKSSASIVKCIADDRGCDGEGSVLTWLLQCPVTPMLFRFIQLIVLPTHALSLLLLASCLLP